MTEEYISPKKVFEVQTGISEENFVYLKLTTVSPSNTPGETVELILSFPQAIETGQQIQATGLEAQRRHSGGLARE